MRRLTARQAAVLDVVEKLGNPTVPQVAAEFRGLPPSAVLRVLRALERVGRVTSSGDPGDVYLGDISYPGWRDLEPARWCGSAASPAESPCSSRCASRDGGCPGSPPGSFDPALTVPTRPPQLADRQPGGAPLTVEYDRLRHLWRVSPGDYTRRRLSDVLAQATGQSPEAEWIQQVERELTGAEKTGRHQHATPIRLRVAPGAAKASRAPTRTTGRVQQVVYLSISSNHLFPTLM